MSTPKPFLFLDSPRVGDIGHAYVIVPGDPTPPEAELVTLSEIARASQVHNASNISARHPVLQPPNNRQGTELLICAGAIPVCPDNFDVIRDVLGSLLKEITEDDLSRDRLRMRGALIYEAQSMRHIAERFYADSRVQNTQWEIVKWEASPPPSIEPPCEARPGLILKRIIQQIGHHPMKYFISTLFLTVIAFATVKGIVNPFVKSTPIDERRLKSDKLDSWRFLADSDWQRLLKATGGSDLAVKMSRIFGTRNAMTSGAQRLQGTGSLKSEKSSDANVPDVSLDEGDNCLKLVRRWYDRFAEEFILTGEFSPERLKSSDLVKYLMMTKASNADPSISSWINDYKEQLKNSKLPEKTMNSAQSLELFLKVVEGRPDDFRVLSDIWKALTRFSEASDSEGTDQAAQLFRTSLGAELKKSTPPPSDFETATVKDAERVEIVKRVLGSKEFASMAIMEPISVDISDWPKIKERIRKGCLYMGHERKDSGAKLLEELDTIFNRQSSTNK